MSVLISSCARYRTFCISLSKAFVDKGYDVVIYAWGTAKGKPCAVR